MLDFSLSLLRARSDMGAGISPACEQSKQGTIKGTWYSAQETSPSTPYEGHVLGDFLSQPHYTAVLDVLILIVKNKASFFRR